MLATVTSRRVNVSRFIRLIIFVCDLWRSKSYVKPIIFIIIMIAEYDLCPCFVLPESFKSAIGTMLDVSLLKDPVFMLIGISNMFGMAGLYIPFVYIVEAATLSVSECAVCVTPSSSIQTIFLCHSNREFHTTRLHFCSPSLALRTHSGVSFAVTLLTSHKSMRCC